MKRVVQKGMALAGIGAFLSVIVAWVLAWWGWKDPGTQAVYSYGAAGEKQAGWLVHRIDTMAATTMAWSALGTRESAEMTRETMASSIKLMLETDPRLSVDVGEFRWPSWMMGEPATAPAVGDRYWEVAQGWPARCVWGRGDQAHGWSGPRLVKVAEGGAGGSAACYLALEPIGVGLAVDTLVYGSVCGVLWWGRTRGRRWNRRRRGRCEGCGYSREGLGEGVACPECGVGE